MKLLRLYGERTRFEIRIMMRDRRTLMFSVILPILLLVVFGSALKQTIGHTNVKFTQYLLAGLLASGLLYSAFQQLAIAVTEERSDGTLKRLRGSPMPPSVYFVGKLGVSAFIYVVQAFLLLSIGHVLFGVHLPHSTSLWLVFVWVSALGLVTSSLLGIAFSNFAKDGRSAAAIAAPLVLFLQFTSGVYFVYTDLPRWMQSVASLFPLKWLAQSMRGVFLPAAFAQVEVGHSFQFARTALVLGLWTIAGAVLCLRMFRWLPKGQS